MCWSFEVSIITGIFSLASGFYLLRRNVRWDRANAVWLITIACIQVCDAVLWWDGMDPQSCTAANWIVSFVAIPSVLSLQCLVRQAEVRFSIAARTAFIVAGVGLFGYLCLPDHGPWATMQYYLNHGCAVPSELEKGSPVWGGNELPVFNFVMYGIITGMPMVKNGRLGELAGAIGMLGFAFTFKEAYGSKWCSICCLLSVYYLFCSGPPNPPGFALDSSSTVAKMTAVTSSDDADKPSRPPFGLARRAGAAMDAYLNFLFATAQDAAPQGHIILL